jgi:hypothetical protein
MVRRTLTALLAGAALSPAAAEARPNRWHVVAPLNSKLERMARCESGGRWWIVSAAGYMGGLQFDLRTWRSVGGRGMPHHASRLEQKYRAALLIRRRGYQPWPVCGSA